MKVKQKRSALKAERLVRHWGFEPQTLGLQSRCSSQLSYIPWQKDGKGKKTIGDIWYIHYTYNTFLLERR